jgi:hypothetical protein
MICDQISSTSSMKTYVILLYMFNAIILRECRVNFENVSIVKQCFFFCVAV